MSAGRLLFTCLLVACPATMARAADDQYLVKVHIAQLPAGAALQVPDKARPMESWQPVPGTDPAADMQHRFPGSQVLSAPSLVTLAGSPATIRTGGNESLQYFEPLGENRYALKESEEKPFLEYGVTVTPGEDEAHVQVTMHCVIAAVADRARLDGTSLPVGKPLFHHIKAEVNEPIAVEKAAWIMHVVPGPATGNTDGRPRGQTSFAIYMRVTDYEAHAAAADQTEGE